MSQRPACQPTAAATSSAARTVTGRFSVVSTRDPAVSLPARHQLAVQDDACALSGRYARQARWKRWNHWLEASCSMVTITLLVAFVVGLTTGGLMLWLSPSTALAADMTSALQR